MSVFQKVNSAPRWPTVATTASLPNVAGSPTQSSSLQVGDDCYVTGSEATYVCTTATLGAAVWQEVSNAGYAPLPTDASAIAIYRFEGNGNDSSGNGLNLAVGAGTPVYLPGPRQRLRLTPYNVGYQFNVTNALVNRGVGDVSVEFLGNDFRDGGLSMIVSHSDAGWTTWGYQLLSFNGFIFSWNTTAGIVDDLLGGSFVLGELGHVVATRAFSGGTTTISWYVNGALVRATPYAHTPVAIASNTLYVGNAGTNAYPFNNAEGRRTISGVGVFNTALSAATVAARARAVLPPGYVR